MIVDFLNWLLHCISLNLLGNSRVWALCTVECKHSRKSKNLPKKNFQNPLKNPWNLFKILCQKGKKFLINFPKTWKISHCANRAPSNKIKIFWRPNESSGSILSKGLWIFAGHSLEWQNSQIPTWHNFALCFDLWEQLLGAVVACHVNPIWCILHRFYSLLHIKINL